MEVVVGEGENEERVLAGEVLDEDGLVALFTLLEPELAGAQRDLLVDVATTGDFGTYRHRDAARIVFTLVATPLFFFSGSFFPIEILPGFIQAVAWAAPLTPGVHVARGFAEGAFDATHLAAAVYLLVLSVAFFPLAVTLLRRRLVK